MGGVEGGLGDRSTKVRYSLLARLVVNPNPTFANVSQIMHSSSPDIVFVAFIAPYLFFVLGGWNSREGIHSKRVKGKGGQASKVVPEISKRISISLNHLQLC